MFQSKVINKSRQVIALSVAVTALLGGMLAFGTAGCGSGAKNTVSAPSRATGNASLTVQWPDRTSTTRLVPKATNSIRIRITNPADSNILAERIIARPSGDNTSTSVENFNGLPVGTLQVEAIAYPNADGTGIAQASANVPVNVRVGQNAPVSLVMGSTIASIEIRPTMLQLEPFDSLPVFITARDAQGNVVLTGSELKWTVTDTSVATVSPEGLVTAGSKTGSTTLNVTEVESGKTASIPIDVIEITLNFVNLNTNDLTFDAFGNKIYATIPSKEGGINGNSVVSIDPTSLAVGQPIFVGSEPNAIVSTSVASDDGKSAKYLFAALQGEAAVVRVDLQKGMVDKKVVVPQFVTSIDISPDSGTNLAVAASKGATFYHFDGTEYKLVSKYAPTPDFPTPVDIVRFDTRINAFSAFNTSAPFGLGIPSTYNLLQYDPDNGLTFTGLDKQLYDGIGIDVRFSGAKGFTSDGHVFQVQPTAIDPLIGPIATLAIGDATAPFVADTKLARAWYLTGGDTGTISVKAFDTNSYLPVGIATIKNVNGLPIRLIRWGDTGLAFNTSGGQVYVLRRAPGLPSPGSQGGGI